MPVDDADGVHGIIDDVFQVILDSLELFFSLFALFDLLLQLFICLDQLDRALSITPFQVVIGLLQSLPGALPLGLSICPDRPVPVGSRLIYSLDDLFCSPETSPAESLHPGPAAKAP